MERSEWHVRLVSWAAGRQLERQRLGRLVVCRPRLKQRVEREPRHRFSSRKSGCRARAIDGGDGSGRSCLCGVAIGSASPGTVTSALWPLSLYLFDCGFAAAQAVRRGGSESSGSALVRGQEVRSNRRLPRVRRAGMVSHSEGSLNAISRMSPPQVRHASGNPSPTRAISFAQAIREVSCERGF